MSVQGKLLAYSIIVFSCLIAAVHPDAGYNDARFHQPRRRVITRVSYEEPREHRVHITKEIHHILHKRKRKKRPVVIVTDGGLPPTDPVVHVPPIHPVSGFDGAYVAVSGTPDRGSVHVVENVPSLGSDSVTVVNGVRVRNRKVGVLPLPRVQPPLAPAPAPIVPHLRGGTVARPPSPGFGTGVDGDRLPLPKCSYVNTDFPGDDLYLDPDSELRGVNAGSARGCKALCRLEEECSFWTYKEGFNRDTQTRDCFLKTGTPGLPVPREAVPRIGFVSGTKDNNCVCIMSDDEEDEVCPYKNPRGLIYPWRSTDQEEDDLSRGLPPTGWTRLGGVGAPPDQAGPGDSLRDDIQVLRAQLDAIARRLDGRK